MGKFTSYRSGLIFAVNMDKKKIVRQDPATRKKAYFERLTSYLQTYNKIMIIGIDNVGAAHLQRVRKQFRDSAQMLMEKKTLMRKCLRQYIDAGHPEFQPLMENLVGNVGLIFTNGDLRSMRNEVSCCLASKVEDHTIFLRY